MKENYQKSKATLLAELSSSETGLSSAQANKNQEKYGRLIVLQQLPVVPIDVPSL